MRKWEEKTLWQALSETAEANPYQLAIISDTERMTYKDLMWRAEKFSIGLLKMGVKKGDKVSMWCPNCTEWIIAKFAIASLGAVLVPISTRFRMSELEYVLKDSDSTTLITTGKNFLDVNFSEIIKEIVPEVGVNDAGKIESHLFPFLKNIILIGESKYKGMIPFSEIEALGQDRQYQNSLKKIRDSITIDDTANMLYTSGTTGMPKGVQLTSSLLSNAFYVGEELSLGLQDKLLLYLPLNHCFALHNGVIGATTHGSTIVLMDPFDTEDSLRVIEKEKVSVLFGVPTTYIMQIEHPKFKEYDISSLRIGMIGGAGVPAAIVQKIMDRMGIRLITVYGMTENSCCATITHYGDSAKILSETVGQALPHIEMKVIDAKTGRTLPSGVEGEICMRGRSITKGYYKKDEETKELIDDDGWLHSGDLGMVDENGYYKITGRSKDLIVRGGENIAPAEIESFLYQHPDVQQVEVVGAPDKKFGEIVAAFIVLKQGRVSTPEDIISFCKGKIASYKIPSIVKIVSEYPLTSSGKVKKFELRKMASQE